VTGDRDDTAWVGDLLSAHAERHEPDVQALLARVLAGMDTAPGAGTGRAGSRRRRAARSGPAPRPAAARPRLLPVGLAVATIVALVTAGAMLPGAWRPADGGRRTVQVGVPPGTSGPAATGPATGPASTATRTPSGVIGTPGSTSAPATGTGTAAARPAGSAVGLPAELRWTGGGPVVGPKPDASHRITGLKDPTVVRHGGRWHVFATTTSAAGFGLVYLSFTDWSAAGSATPYYLDRSAIGGGYRAAPQVFWFAPQKLWYLVYQNGNAAYSTNPDIGNPGGWSAPRTFFGGTPAIIDRNKGADGYWVDQWVICDDGSCYLFSSDENGHLYRSRTSRAQFPQGMSQPVIALQEPDKNDLFEGSNVYRIAGTGRYLLLVDATPGGRHYFRSWTSASLTGPWTPLAGTPDRPFAGTANVTLTGGAWTQDVGHGELLRAGEDQTLTIDPCGLRFLYSATPTGVTGPFNELPWRLGLLTQQAPCTP